MRWRVCSRICRVSGNNMDPSELPLRDIHLPDPVAWWPPAPGWWVLAAILLLCAIMAIRQWRRRRTVAYRFRRGAFAIARGLRARPRHRPPDSAWVDVVAPRLPERLSARPVAGLSGVGWAGFVAKLLGQDGVANEFGQLLYEAPYRPGTAVDADEYLDLLARVASRLDIRLESD